MKFLTLIYTDMAQEHTQTSFSCHCAFLSNSSPSLIPATHQTDQIPLCLYPCDSEVRCSLKMKHEIHSANDVSKADILLTVMLVQKTHRARTCYSLAPSSTPTNLTQTKKFS